MDSFGVLGGDENLSLRSSFLDVLGGLGAPGGVVVNGGLKGSVFGIVGEAAPGLGIGLSSVLNKDAEGVEREFRGVLGPHGEPGAIEYVSFRIQWELPKLRCVTKRMSHLSGSCTGDLSEHRG